MSVFVSLPRVWTLWGLSGLCTEVEVSACVEGTSTVCVHQQTEWQLLLQTMAQHWTVTRIHTYQLVQFSLCFP